MTTQRQSALEGDMIAFRDRYLAEHPGETAANAGLAYLMQADRDQRQQELEDRQLRQAAVIAIQQTMAELAWQESQKPTTAQVVVGAGVTLVKWYVWLLIIVTVIGIPLAAIASIGGN